MPPAARLILIGLIGLCGSVGLTALGLWQVQRLAWKHALIERVESRVNATPVPATGPELWVGAQAEEYRKVSVSGRFRHEAETLVQAVTELGGGFWVLTPLVTEGGFTVLVNRGFVPPERRDPQTRAAAQTREAVTVTGLVRLSEPGGGFLRDNDPAGGRWYSRDVGAIAQARGLGTAAPYFIDADAAPNPGGFPVGGLTVLRFSDNHLVYALTWFALALMMAGATGLVMRAELRRRRPGEHGMR